jgi:heat shock protein HslJ
MRRLLAALAVIAAACGGAAEPTTQPDRELAGDWELVEGTVAGSEIPRAEFRITLLLEAGTAGGVAACNSYGGEYTVNDWSIQFGLMYQTEMACAEPAMSAESLYLRGLSGVDTYLVAADRLTLSGVDVTLIFATILPIETAPLYDQRWVLESLIEGEGVSSVQGNGFLVLTEDGVLSGSTGCRDVSGVFIVVADEIVPTEFGADGECPPDLGQQDSHFITVIEGGFSAFVEEDRLTLLDPDGTGLQFRAGG